MKKLNLGCGTDIRYGFINLDIAPINGVDVVHNIEGNPLPFENDTFDEVLCQDILEHLEYIPVLKEIHRILKKGGKLKIRVPHFSSSNNYRDPTHKKMFSIKTFDFFVENSGFGRNYYFDFSFSKIISRRIDFTGGIKYFLYNWLIQITFGNKAKLQNIYELTLFSRIFPATNIIVELVK